MKTPPAPAAPGSPLPAAPAPAGAAGAARAITGGPRHHFFGYFGHAGTVPWNRSGRYVVALRTNFQDRMHRPGEAAEVVLIDARNGYAARAVDRTPARNV